MNEILDIEIILTKNKYHFIYKISTILITCILVFIYITYIYSYQSYYITKGKVIDNKLEVILPLDNIKYITKHNNLIIDDQKHNYKIVSISDELYVDESYNNYKYVYLEVDKINNINNYVYEIKLKKENKKIINYIKDYLQGG